MRWVVSIGRQNIRWPRGFKAVVSAAFPVLLTKDGSGPPTNGPLLMMVNQHGELEFDIFAESVLGAGYLDFGNAVDNQNIDRFRLCFPGWRMLPIPASVDGGAIDIELHGGVTWEMCRGFEHDVKWSTPAGWTGAYVVEVSRGEGDGNWRPMRVVESGLTQWTFGTDLWNNFSGYLGPLRFRVVPVSSTPP